MSRRPRETPRGPSTEDAPGHAPAGIDCCAALAMTGTRCGRCEYPTPRRRCMVMGEIERETQVVVIGGGPGGYAAAFRAADLGKEVVLIEAGDALGGECLH